MHDFSKGWKAVPCLSGKEVLFSSGLLNGREISTWHRFVHSFLPTATFTSKEATFTTNFPMKEMGHVAEQKHKEAYPTNTPSDRMPINCFSLMEYFILVSIGIVYSTARIETVSRARPTKKPNTMTRSPTTKIVSHIEPLLCDSGSSLPYCSEEVACLFLLFVWFLDLSRTE